MERWLRMFGSIAKMKVKAGSFEKMIDLVKIVESQPVEGRLFMFVYRSQTDPDEAWAVSGFTDEPTYRADAEDPHKSAQFEQWQQLLAGPPEWHDGEIVWDRHW
jgi:quinol monooxygenase YgiN